MDGGKGQDEPRARERRGRGGHKLTSPIQFGCRDDFSCGAVAAWAGLLKILEAFLRRPSKSFPTPARAGLPASDRVTTAFDDTSSPPRAPVMAPDNAFVQTAALRALEIYSEIRTLPTTGL